MVELWALTDYRPGTANQVLGVARHTGFHLSEKKLDYNNIASLPNYMMLGNGLRGIKKHARAKIKASWPDIVISAGRRTAPVAAYIKAKHPQTTLVHFMRPQWKHDCFDMLIYPRHDIPQEESNDTRIITTLGAPHILSDETLFAARARLPLNPELLPKPWTLLCLGGNTSHGNFMLSDMDALLKSLEPFARSGTILLTTSRRTPSALAHSALETIARIYPTVTVESYLSNQGTENPYHAWLAQADTIIVSGDSVSMISEAAYTGKAVYSFMPEKAAGAKHRRFVDHMVAEGYVKHIEGYEPLWKGGLKLDEAKRIGHLIRDHITNN